MTRPSTPPKMDVARALLLRGSLFVHLDPRRDGVSVPPWLGRQPQLVLQLGLDLPVPIPDLRVDDDGVFGTLSFNRAPHTCVVPWDAVFALRGDDGMGMVWPEDLPDEIAAEVERAASGPKLSLIDGGRAEPPAGGGARGELAEALRVEEAPPDANEADQEGAFDEVGLGESDDEAPAPARRGLPPYLRVIK